MGIKNFFKNIGKPKNKSIGGRYECGMITYEEALRQMAVALAHAAAEFEYEMEIAKDDFKDHQENIKNILDEMNDAYNGGDVDSLIQLVRPYKLVDDMNLDSVIQEYSFRNLANLLAGIFWLEELPIIEEHLGRKVNIEEEIIPLCLREDVVKEAIGNIIELDFLQKKVLPTEENINFFLMVARNAKKLRDRGLPYEDGYHRLIDENGNVCEYEFDAIWEPLDLEKMQKEFEAGLNNTEK